MQIDLHIHTMVSSPCSMLDPEECIQRAIELELDAICVTEHETLEGGRVVRDLARKKGFRVFVGMEVMSREAHLLVYGYDQEFHGMKSAAEIVETVTAAGGIVVPAHPYRYPFGWFTGDHGPDLAETDFPTRFRVIEMYNGLTSDDGNRKARALCERFGLHGIAGSDSHAVEHIGACYTEFDETVEDEKHLASLIREGRCRPVSKKSI